MAKNNRYYALASAEVHARYTTTIPAVVTGKRINPLTNEVEDFALNTTAPFVKFDKNEAGSVVVKKVGIDQDNNVIDIYSEQEDVAFKRLNRIHFNNGTLVPYTTYKEPTINVHNTLTEDQVVEFAKIKMRATFERKLKDIDSVSTLQRIKEACEVEDKPISFSKAVDARINELRN